MLPKKCVYFVKNELLCFLIIFCIFITILRKFLESRRHFIVRALVFMAPSAVPFLTDIKTLQCIMSCGCMFREKLHNLSRAGVVLDQCKESCVQYC